MPQPQLQYLPTDQSPPIGRLPCFKHRLAGIACLLAVWYASSLLTSMSTKEILRTFPYPITLAAVQQAIAVACGWLSLRREKTGKTRCELLADRHLHLSTLPIASVMVCSLATYRWALMSASVSFVHTIKTLLSARCGSPLRRLQGDLSHDCLVLRAMHSLKGSESGFFMALQNALNLGIFNRCKQYA